MKFSTSLALVVALSGSTALAQQSPPAQNVAPKAPSAPAGKTSDAPVAPAAAAETSPPAAEENTPAGAEAEEPPVVEEAAPPTEQAPPIPEEKESEEPPPPAYTDDYAGAENSPKEELASERAPSPFMLGLLWDTVLPVGNTADYVGKFSPQGFSIDGRYSGFGELGLGVTMAWHVLEQRTRSTTSWQNATITGTQIREVSSSPFTFKISYAKRDLGKVIPYAGLGLGAARVFRRLDMGISSLSDQSWHFAFVPELGVEVPMKSFSLLASTRFNYFVKGDGAPAQTYMNFSVGVGFQ